jgi:glycosyltransferase involved in cell wall biosynthesis
MLPQVTICFTYFKSLALANLEAALHSVYRQDLSGVESIVIVDNDTNDSEESVSRTVQGVGFKVPVRFFSFKHGDATRTHSWSTNVALSMVRTPWVLFTRADYLLDFDALRKFAYVVRGKPSDWNGFVTGNVYHLNIDIGACERTSWRVDGPRVLRAMPGAEADYTHIDAGVWMTRLESFDVVGGLNEKLTAWGHAQTHFQWKLSLAGVDFVRIPEVLFYHPLHAAERDIGVAHQQIAERGVDLRKMWARYEGAQPY